MGLTGIRRKTRKKKLAAPTSRRALLLSGGCRCKPCPRPGGGLREHTAEEARVGRATGLPLHPCRAPDDDDPVADPSPRRRASKSKTRSVKLRRARMTSTFFCLSFYPSSSLSPDHGSCIDGHSHGRPTNRRDDALPPIRSRLSLDSTEYPYEYVQNRSSLADFAPLPIRLWLCTARRHEPRFSMRARSARCLIVWVLAVSA